MLPEIGELCEPNDSGSMAEAIVRIVSRPDWSQMGAAARQHVAASFSWESSFERLFLMYEDVVAARRGSS